MLTASVCLLSHCTRRRRLDITYYVGPGNARVNVEQVADKSGLAGHHLLGLVRFFRCLNGNAMHISTL